MPHIIALTLYIITAQSDIKAAHPQIGSAPPCFTHDNTDFVGILADRMTRITDFVGILADRTTKITDLVGTVAEIHAIFAGICGLLAEFDDIFADLDDDFGD